MRTKGRWRGLVVALLAGLGLWWGGCLAPTPSSLRKLLLTGSTQPCKVSDPHFADLHIHPFERFFQRNEPKGRFVLFMDRAPLRKLQHSGLSLLVASLVMPQNTGLSVSYAQATRPGKTRKQLRDKVRRTISHEILLAKGLLRLENTLLDCCGLPDAKHRALAIERFRESDELRQWRRSLQQLPPALQRHLDHYVRLRLRDQKRAFVCERPSPQPGRCGRPFQVVYTAAQAKQAVASGKIAVVLALEQLGYIASPDDVDYFYAQGIRLSTLVHLSDNCLTGSADIPWAHGGITMMQKGLSGFRAHLPKRRCAIPLPATIGTKAPAILAQRACPTRQHNATSLLQVNGNQGLTKRGLWVLWQMVRRGMLVDLSHSTETTMRQLLWCQKQQAQHPKLPPFLHSHTNFRVAIHKRLPEYPISGAHLKALYQGGGMVGMGFHRDATNYMYPTPQEASYSTIKPSFDSLLPAPPGQLSGAQKQELWELQAVLHNMHALIMREGGPRTIAFGTDYNGRIDPPDLFPFANKLPQLISLMQRKQCKLYKQMAGSAAAFIKLWQRAERVAQQWQDRPPATGEICKPMQAQLHPRCPWQ